MNKGGMEPGSRGARPGPVNATAEQTRGSEAPPNEGRLADLYRRHADHALRLAYLLTGDRELAQDLVQDAFVRLAGRLAHLRDPEAFEAYLRRTIVNLAYSHFRRLKVERTWVRSNPPAADPGTEFADPGVRDELWAAMANLPPRQRAAL